MAISLGDITFGIGPDTTRLRSSINDITSFGRAVEHAAALAAAGASSGEAALRRQENAAIAALQKVQRFQDQVAKLGAPAKLAESFNQLSTTALDRVTAALTSGRLSALEYQRAMTQFGQTMSNTNRQLQGFVETQRTMSQNSMVESLRKLSGAAVLVAGPLSGIATRISVVASLADHFNVAWAGMIVGMASGAYAFYKFATAAVDVEKKLQNIEQTFTAVSGSSTIAQIQMKYLAEFADKAGVKFDDLAKNYAQITAAAKGTVLEGERTQMIFEAITMAGAKLGLSGEEVKGTLVAIQQMMSKGRITAEELRQQLGDRFPGAVQIMATAAGVTTQALDKMMRAGDLNISMLVKFADEVKKRYSIDENTKIDTIMAAENRLANARTRMIDSLDKVIGFTSAYTNVLNALTNGINGASTRTQELVQKVLQVGIALIAAFGSAIVIRGVTAIAQGVIGLTSAIIGLNVATAAGAFQSFAKLLLTASVAVAAYYGSEKLMQDVLKDSKQSFLNTKPAVEDYIKAQQTLASSITTPTKEYIKQQEDMLESQKKQRASLAEQAKPLQAFREQLEKVGNTTEFVDTVMKSMGEWELVAKLTKADAAIDSTEKKLQELQDILKRQKAIETDNRDDPIKALTDRQLLAVKNAKDTVNELNQNFANIGKEANAKDWANLQVDIAKKIENFRDQLTRTQLPLEQVTTLTNAYAEALRKLKEGEHLFDTGKTQGDAIEMATRQITSLKGQIKNMYIKDPQAKEFANQQVEINEQIDTFRDKLEKAQVPVEKIRLLTDDYGKSLKRLKDGELKLAWDTNTTRQTVAIKNANDTVRELTQTFDLLYKAPAAKEWGTVQNEISKAVENFRDKLTETKLPVSEVTALTDKYAAALRKVKEGEYGLSKTTSYFQATEQVFGRSLDKGLDAWISTITEGKDKLEALKDVAKAVAADILKTWLTLAALNPLKNMLFGTNYPVLGGSAGVGGLLGNGISSFFGGGSPEATALAGGITPLALGGVMTSAGPKPLRRYSQGGVARGSQFAEYGEGSKPEAYVPLPDGRSIPVSMSGGAGAGFEMHIHEAPGFKAQTTKSQGAGGKPRIDVAFKQLFRDAFINDVSEGGPASQVLERQYGMNRARGISS